MVKLVFCLRRKEGLSLAEFQRYWREQHAQLVSKHAAVLGIRRYVQVHAIESPFNEIVQGGRGSPGGYDGVAELWWDSFDAMADVGATDEGIAAAEELTDDERTFIDHSKSPIFFAEEVEIIPDGAEA